MSGQNQASLMASAAMTEAGLAFVAQPSSMPQIRRPTHSSAQSRPEGSNGSLSQAAMGGSLLGLTAMSRRQKRAKRAGLRVATADVKTLNAPDGEDEMMAGVSGGAMGGYTQSNVASRRVVPTEAQQKGRKYVKVVYVVLESQYQSAMTTAIKQINKTPGPVCMECVGYLLEEIRSEASEAELAKDMQDANIFICSLIFVQELAEKLVKIVEPCRDQLDACLCFPSMPEVMKQNKLGTFDLTQIAGGPLGNFAQQVKDLRQKSLSKSKPTTGGNFQDSLLKLVRTLPKVLKFLPGDQAKDARTFVLSLQHWLGGTPENLEAMLLRVAGGYVKGVEEIDTESLMDPVVLPDMGIWHPLAPQIFDTMADYREWYDKVHCPAAGLAVDAPTIGLVLQKSHIATKDDGHYVGMVQELERRGARVACTYTGGLDFSVPVQDFLSLPSGEGAVDALVNLTGFSLVGGPASQDAKKAKEVLMRFNRPYLVSVPLVFQSFTEWQNSQLGLHPVQVALQVSLPEIDGAIEPLIFSGRDGTSGRSIPMQDRISSLGLKELSDLVKSYQGLRENEQRGASIVNSIIATARQCNLDKDIDNLPSEEDDMAKVTMEQRDDVVGKVYRLLMEIESRALPMGLHQVGVPPTAAESVATLVNIAQLDRPEMGIRSLPRIIAETQGKDIEAVYKGNNEGNLEDVALIQQITEASRKAVGALVAQSTNEEGRVSEVNPFGDIFNFFMGGSPYKKALEEVGFDCPDDQLKPLFEYLQVCLGEVVRNNEVPSLIKALDGNFIEPGPGGDPIRNPDVLPTGKNMHALDPNSIPTKAACDVALVVVERLLDSLKEQQGGELPESIAFTLWGTDNIKTYGESLAQVLALVGARPVPDSLGRVNKVQLIPLEQLGRPRIDVVCNCSGVFRDLFINQMNLLDRAIKEAAEADEPLEMNFVRKHAMEQAEELNISLRQAATRVFSNAAGSYSANVGIAIENGAKVDEDQLQEQFVTRKGFALSSDAPGELQEASSLFKSALQKVDVTFQNLDSSEISLTDVSHYFDNDPTKVVSNLRKDGKKPASLIADTTTANAQVRSLSAQVRLDSRTKLLNPKFYEANLKGGYEGVREISKRMRFTFGWSTTADAVDNFVYEDCNTTYIQDEEIKNKMLEANPDALRDMVETFLEANAKGYWDTSEDNLEKLKEVYQECEDRIEGVDFTA
ncbi:unnamed protein product [Effrenium voratum]|uniref:magnesium chelatase n=1 Tax=Effrenium voratum TaxID=2562239 RepID=A0AA36NFS4_9DINO|nr:unnamed protein product [Effrenium voratum]